MRVNLKLPSMAIVYDLRLPESFQVAFYILNQKHTGNRFISVLHTYSEQHKTKYICTGREEAQGYLKTECSQQASFYALFVFSVSKL